MKSFLNRFLLLFLIVFVVSACAQHPEIPDTVPYGPEPATPSMEALNSVAKQDAAEFTRHEVNGEKGEKLFYYTLDDERYSGWAYQEFPNEVHRFRFTKYDNGWPVWQVGYYSNGKLDLDFHMQEGKSLGSERMWRENGTKYIDYFYSAAGEMHGVQRRWYADNILAYQAEYNKGELIYEISYNNEGDITDLKGDVPNELLNRPKR